MHVESMLDLIGGIFFYAAFIVSPVVFGVTVYRLRRVRKDRLLMRLWIGLLLGGVSFLVLMAFAFGIVLRNGLGPT